MHLSGREMFAAPNDSVFINLNFVRDAKGDDLVAYTNNKPWKIFNVAVGPFEIDVLERAVFASGAHVLLDGSKWSTNGAIDAVARDDDASFESEAFAQGSLPKPYRVGVANRGKRIEKNDFGGIDTENVAGSGAMNGGIRFPLFTEVFCAFVVIVFDMGKYRENIAK